MAWHILRYFASIPDISTMLRQAALRSRMLRLPQPSNISRKYATDTAASRSRIERLESRLPRFLQRIVTPLRSAPVSHATAFLILHEITAIVPLFGLAATFYYSNWLPPLISEGKWIQDYTEKFGRWARKRGWVKEEERSGRWWGRGEGGVRIFTALATAYAVMKILLPLRLMVSVWGTPWFARWTTLPLMNGLRRRFVRGSAGKASPSPAAGAGAVGASVLPKEAKIPAK